MIRPPEIDFDLSRGSNVAPVILALEAGDDGTPFPVHGSVFVLTVRVPGAPLRKRTDVAGSGFVLDEAGATLTWTPTLAESRTILRGRFTAYEVERRVGGSQTPFFSGVITGVGGLNDDG